VRVAAVAWDIDGTLVDSEPLHLEALRAACNDYGVDISDLSDDAFVGVNVYDAWTRLKGHFPTGMDRADLITKINSYYAENSPLRVVPTTGAVDTVLTLYRAIPQVAVSNSNRVVVDANLNVLGLERAITWSVSLDDVARGKPDPLPYLNATSRLQLRASRILAVEDSGTGVQSAKAAGPMVVGFSKSGVHIVGADRNGQGACGY
jgi:HAD superfamily hydrolase (TIGR01509 family)